MFNLSFVSKFKTGLIKVIYVGMFLIKKDWYISYFMTLLKI